MGIGADDTLSPDLQKKLTYLGTVLSSFPEAHRATAVLLENVFGVKRIERLTERIGRERIVERDADVEAWQRRTRSIPARTCPNCFYRATASAH